MEHWKSWKPKRDGSIRLIPTSRWPWKWRLRSLPSSSSRLSMIRLKTVAGEEKKRATMRRVNGEGPIREEESTKHFNNQPTSAPSVLEKPASQFSPIAATSSAAAASFNTGNKAKQSSLPAIAPCVDALSRCSSLSVGHHPGNPTLLMIKSTSATCKSTTTIEDSRRIERFWIICETFRFLSRIWSGISSTMTSSRSCIKSESLS